MKLMIILSLIFQVLQAKSQTASKTGAKKDQPTLSEMLSDPAQYPAFIDYMMANAPAEMEKAFRELKINFLLFCKNEIEKNCSNQKVVGSTEAEPAASCLLSQKNLKLSKKCSDKTEEMDLFVKARKKKTEEKKGSASNGRGHQRSTEDKDRSLSPR